MMSAIKDIASRHMGISSIPELITTKLQTWFEAFVTMLPNLLLAALVFAAFLIASRYIEKLVRKLFVRFAQNEIVVDLGCAISRIVLLILGTFFALGILKLDKTVTSLLAGAGVIGLAIGFAFQEIASNFIAGIILAFREPFKVGDIVQIESYVGKIKTMNLRTTIITTLQGLEVIIPNKDMFTSPVTNYTSTPVRRIDLSVGISYGENLRRVKEVVAKALENIEGRIGGKEIEVFFSEFGDSSINFSARVWVDNPDQIFYQKTVDKMVVLIKEAFDREGITIPFPIRTLDFGIKGGKQLSEVWERPRQS